MLKRSIRPFGLILVLAFCTTEGRLLASDEPWVDATVAGIRADAGPSSPCRTAQYKLHTDRADIVICIVSFFHANEIPFEIGDHVRMRVKGKLLRSFQVMDDKGKIRIAVIASIDENGPAR